MTRKNHTPGPWRASVSNNKSPAVRGSDNRLIVVVNCQATTEERLANQALIAAAPDLLAALEQILADWDSISPSVQVPDEINADSHWEAIRTAIAKAQGEST